MDRFARVRGDTRIRATADGRSSVATGATSEPLGPVPALPHPVIVSESRRASRQAMVSYRGDRYSVSPELASAQVLVSHPVGGGYLDIATASIVIARHQMAADGLAVMVRDSGHVIALDAAAMAATAATGRPHRRKEAVGGDKAPACFAASFVSVAAGRTRESLLPRGNPS